MKKQSLLYPLSFALMLLTACTGNKHTQEEGQSADSVAAPVDTTPISEEGVYMFNYAIINLPSPINVLNEYAAAGLPVDVDLLNPYENVDKYQTTVSRALNFGIYGIDLAYLVVNKHVPDLMNYYNSSRKLALELNIAETFDRFTTRFEANSSNRDSLLRIIDDAYTNTDRYLRTNERLETASEILAGSWLEAQYITVSLLKNEVRTEANDSLYNHIWQQSYHLDNISKIFSELNSTPEVKAIKREMDALLAMYKELKSSKDVTPEYISKLSAKLTEVRKKVTK